MFARLREVGLLAHRQGRGPVSFKASVGSCQNEGPFVGTLNNRCRIIIGTQAGDHNFDNHPYKGLQGEGFPGFRACTVESLQG